jgi:hypothetical protein
MMNDLSGLAIMLVTLSVVWYYPSRCLMTGVIVSNALLVIVAGNDPVVWHGLVTFPAQFSPVLSCLTLLVGSLRIGVLPTHHAWRVSILTLLGTFLMATRYPEAIYAAPQLRIWSSVFFQIAIVGGIGQVLWKYTDISNWARFLITMLAFPIGSVLHNFFAFYPIHDFWGIAASSILPTLLASFVSMLFVVLMNGYDPSTDAQKKQRYGRSNTELV